MLIFFPLSLKLPQMHKICYTPLLHPLFFHVPRHSLKGSLEFNSIDSLSTQFDHLCCRLLFNQAHLGLSIPQFQALLSVSGQARTALLNGLILILLFEMCRALNFNWAQHLL